MSQPKVIKAKIVPLDMDVADNIGKWDLLREEVDGLLKTYLATPEPAQMLIVDIEGWTKAEVEGARNKARSYYRLQYGNQNGTFMKTRLGDKGKVLKLGIFPKKHRATYATKT